MSFEDYYEVMQLDVAADAAAIKQAYRRLVRLYHPDVNRAPEAHDSMARVNEAYEALSDPGRRAAYDDLRRRELARPAPTPATEPPADRDTAGTWKQGFDVDGEPTPGRTGEAFSDFFTSMFGRPADVRPARPKARASAVRR